LATVSVIRTSTAHSRRLWAASALTLALALGACGEESAPTPTTTPPPPSDPTQARAIERTWDDFRRATAAGDARRVCRDLLSPKAADYEAAIGGTCMRNVRREKLYTDGVGPLIDIRVNASSGAGAADYRRPGEKRPFSVQFIQQQGRWRIHQLFRRYGY
jgi:hypothetical protein